jgi:hypothetical protein
MNEALVEHNSAKQLIVELEKMQGDDPMLRPTSEQMRARKDELKPRLWPRERALHANAGAAERITALTPNSARRYPWQAALSIPTTCRHGAAARP